jgi:cell division protein FtsZ
MKGARGLLISITGGKDLTLYEVDEAATRIREEVDQDANIIVGATFDETLEGIIRVSVVATGIDNTGIMQQPQPAESALKELASKMRNDSKRIADRVERVSPAKPGVATAPPMDSAAFNAAHAAVAAAILPVGAIEDVSFRPMPVKPSLFELHPAGARAGDARPAHAADRRIADPRPEPDRRFARRAGREPPGKAAHVADAAVGLGRSWQADGRQRNAAGAARRPADAAIRPAAAAADRPQSGRPSRGSPPAGESPT